MINTDNTTATQAEPDLITLQQFFTRFSHSEIDLVSPREGWRCTADRCKARPRAQRDRNRIHGMMGRRGCTAGSCSEISERLSHLFGGFCYIQLQVKHFVTMVRLTHPHLPFR
jgi:hypothetical protein